MPLSQAQVVALLESLYPPGFTRWMNFEPGSDMDNFAQGFAAELLADGFNLADTLVVESNPATAIQKLPDWEAAMGLGQTQLALFGTTTQRQTQLIAYSRNRGTPTIALLQALLGPVLGYANPGALQVLQHSRASITALNTYIITPLGAIIPPNAFVSATFSVKDAPLCSQAGVQVTFTVTHPHVDQLIFNMQGPNNAISVTFLAGGLAQGGWTNDRGSVTNKSYTIGLPQFAGKNSFGIWTLSLGDTGGNVGILVSSSLFVDGIGRYIWNPNLGKPDQYAEGLGALLFEFNILVNPTLAGAILPADYPTASLLLQKATPAHCRSYLCRIQTNGSTQAICGDPNCLSGACIS